MNGQAPAPSPTPILEVTDLAISYETRTGDVPAVRGVNFTIHEGRTVGLVGESGCGKSTIAFGILDFLGQNGKIVGGSIRFRGEEMVGRSKESLRTLRGNQISMVYQDPMQALNPSLRLGEQMTEVLTAHQEISREAARDRALRMLRRVYMPDADSVMARYPHQISGGQQQRVVIAMAMLNNPALLLMDEPTTALDVTVEAAVLDLVQDLKAEYNTGIVFISHNMGVVARVSDELLVMYAGEMVEKGSIRSIFAQPAHPYTRGLLSCIPRLNTDKFNSTLWSIRGRVPPPAERGTDACIFEPRCDFATEECSRGRPDLATVSDGHVARCRHIEQTLRHSMDEFRRGQGRDRAGRERERESAGAKDGPLLSVDQMKLYYEQSIPSVKSVIGMGEKRYVKAVDDVSFQVWPGQTLGVVGESGCGKSTLVKGIIGLEDITGGKNEFTGIDISRPVNRRDLDLIREIQMVFQNPDSTLNPSYSVGSQIARPIRRFQTVPNGQVRAEVNRLLRAVKLAAYFYDRLPRQLSGGEKQRVGIARALASRPDLVICDEPVSALDVSVQAAVMNLLIEIQAELGTTMIFIAHDLSVVRYLSDWIAVMYLGRIVEIGPAEEIYAPPYHPYTEALLSAIPIPDPTARQRHIRLGGNVPSALHPPNGCHFHTRCPRRDMLPDGGEICEREVPPWRVADSGHRILCHIPLEELMENEDVLGPQAAPTAAAVAKPG